MSGLEFEWHKFNRMEDDGLGEKMNENNRKSSKIGENFFISMI